MPPWRMKRRRSRRPPSRSGGGDSSDEEGEAELEKGGRSDERPSKGGYQGLLEGRGGE